MKNEKSFISTVLEISDCQLAQHRLNLRGGGGGGGGGGRIDSLGSLPLGQAKIPENIFSCLSLSLAGTNSLIIRLSYGLNYETKFSDKHV